MKKKFQTYCLLWGLFTTLASAGQPPKFGYANATALLAELPEVKKADNELQAYQSSLQKKGQDMVKSLQEQAAEIQKKQESGFISPLDYESQSTQLKKDEEKINNYAKEIEVLLSKKREELYKPILDRVNRAMAAVAKENGYLMVFDSGTQVLLFAEEYLDVSRLVKAKLGL